MNKKKLLPSYLDDKVVFSMIGVTLISFFIMAYKYKTYTPCQDFTIDAKSPTGHFYTGEIIRFATAGAKSFKKWEWHFGDEEIDRTAVSYASHAYDQPGEYTITVTANGTCTEYRTIVITRAPVIENPLLIPKIICPQSAEVGKAVSFSDTTNGATQWEWRFGETGTVDATSRAASYVYTSPGIKSISLIVNNDPRQYISCKVMVNLPAPEAPKNRPPAGGGRQIVINAKPETDPLEPEPVTNKPPEIVKAPEISFQQFEANLKAVSNGYKTAEDFAPYLCDNLNVQTLLNGESLTFRELCNKFASFKSSKKIKQLSVHLTKNSQSNCIILVTVVLKKRENLIDRIF